MTYDDAGKRLEATKIEDMLCPIGKILSPTCLKEKCIAYIEPKISYNIAIPFGDDGLLNRDARYAEYYVVRCGCKLLK